MSGYIGPQPVPQATQTREAFTATSGQTTFNTGGYTAGYIDVFLNGVKLAAADYTATNGSDVVLATGAATGDILETVAYTTFTVADQDFTGTTTAEDLTVTGAFTSQGIDDNATSTAMTLDSSGNLLVGSTTTDGFDGTSGLKVASSTAGFLLERTSTRGWLQYIDTSGGWRLYDSTDNADRIVVDTSGNLLVGTTNANAAVSNVLGHSIKSGGLAEHSNDDVVVRMNRKGSNGSIAECRKDGSVVGGIAYNGSGIGIFSSSVYTGIGGTATAPYYWAYNLAIYPAVDNSRDLGTSGNRFDDVFATNGTIQTSDQNEKQQIASLTDAEITAAKAISKLFKTFKWNDSVTEKGDAARTHTGVIAQQVETAMTDAGLDAGDYAFFISSTWWETQTEVPAVEADEENGVEAQEAYTRTDTYDTAKAAPEGATERNRKGIRYPQLLSFVAAATEQRLASIETRLDALEAN